MSDSQPATANRAVFLSYASQDTVAVLRICAALRAAGIEVWFDQDALVGGDAWDGKIRGQIASCALFIPVISANTQARQEGYFRLEWKIAAQRTHMMSGAKAFLLPVVIDETRDAEAHVPAEFRAVQWTRLPGGETPEKFCARVKSLLGVPEVARAFQPVGSGLTGQETRATRPVGRRVPAFIGRCVVHRPTLPKFSESALGGCHSNIVPFSDDGIAARWSTASIAQFDWMGQIKSDNLRWGKPALHSYDRLRENFLLHHTGSSLPEEPRLGSTAIGAPGGDNPRAYRRA